MGEAKKKRDAEAAVDALLTHADANGIPIIRVAAEKPLRVPRPQPGYIVTRWRKAVDIIGLIVVPDEAKTEEGQQKNGGMWVIAVGEGVTRCKVGDEVVLVQQSAGDQSNVLYAGSKDVERAMFILPEKYVIATMPPDEQVLVMEDDRDPATRDRAEDH